MTKPLELVVNCAAAEKEVTTVLLPEASNARYDCEATARLIIFRPTLPIVMT